jgi:hypothetical protein
MTADMSERSEPSTETDFSEVSLDLPRAADPEPTIGASGAMAGPVWLGSMDLPGMDADEDAE